MENYKLTNDLQIPAIGLGTYPMTGDTLTKSVVSAFECGFRLIDTADNYYNEEDLGESLTILYNMTSAKRDDLFLVSKVSDELYRPGELGGGSNKGIYFWKTSSVMQEENAVKRIIREKIDRTLKYLKTDYLDLYLMHWPYPDYFLEIWHEMEQIYQVGKVKAIGVCNCRTRHFEKLKGNCQVFPMINQFETSPLNTKEREIQYCNENKVKVMVYSPLMSLKYQGEEAYNMYLKELATKYYKDKSQIVLRFNVQRGLIPIPKSSNPLRLKSNISVFDFELTQEEMDVLKGFNKNRAYLPESKSCPGI